MKKKNQLLTILLIATGTTFASGQQVGIGTNQPDKSSILELKSNTQGFLPPRMTEAQRNNIDSPAEGLVVYNTDEGCLNYRNAAKWISKCDETNPPQNAITDLACATATHNGTLLAGSPASGVSFTISYTGGNGDSYDTQNITSTGIYGLTATLVAGNFTHGNGTLTYNITGTPTWAGTAIFTINIGGQNCILTKTVSAAPPVSCGTVSFNYNGSSVSYGTVLSATGRCWLDRNLGATQIATSATDYHAYGDLFQWGRSADGHQRITWTSSTTGTPVNGITTTLSPSNVVGHNLFILSSGEPNDWRSPQNNNLWQGVNGINNPCPAGFRIPTITELQAEIDQYHITDTATAYASPLKFTASGSRNGVAGLNGSLENLDSNGIYWSSSTNGNYSRSLIFKNGSAYTTNTTIRTYGSAVRCIKN